jgi:hypothetical protein
MPKTKQPPAELQNLPMQTLEKPHLSLLSSMEKPVEIA